MTLHVPTALLAGIICGVIGFAVATATNPQSSNASNTVAHTASSDTKILKQIRDKMTSNATNLHNDLNILNNKVITTNKALDTVNASIITLDGTTLKVCKNVQNLAASYTVSCY